MPNEIITLQIGHYANFVGTHFWNTQDSYADYNGSNAGENEVDQDILFRAGQTLSGEETYTPRLLVFDLKGSFRTLKKASALYEPEANADINASAWEGSTATFSESRYDQNDYLKTLENPEADFAGTSFAPSLSSSVRVWSDFNRIYYHPKTLIEVPDYRFGDEERKFDLFNQGRESATPDFVDDVVEERLRWWAEECDRLQGFQILTDTADGFSGLSAALLESIRDAYPRAGILTYGLHYPRHFTPNDNPHHVIARQMANLALATHSFIENSSLYIPLRTPTLPLWKLDHGLAYHTSAPLAAMVDTFLLPFRSRHSYMSFTDLPTLSPVNMAGLAGAIPFPLLEEKDFLGIDETFKTGKWLADFSSLPIKLSLGSVAVLRGVANDRVNQSKIQQTLLKWLSQLKPGGGSGFNFKTAFNVNETFPQNFSGLTENGLQAYETDSITELVKKLPVMALLHVNPDALGTTLAQSSEHLKKLDYLSMTKFEEGDHGLSKDEMSEVSESLREMADQILDF